MTVTVAPPRRRVEKIDMNAQLAMAAPNISRVLGDLEENPHLVRHIRRDFAAARLQWDLGGQVTDLTQWDDVGVKISNAKVAKNKRPTLSLTLSSHAQCRRTMIDGRIQVLNTCPWAGACSAVCVLKHGRGAFPKVIRARNWRTSLLYDWPVGFVVLLRHEIQRAAAKAGGPFLARLNVNSDLPWHLIPELFEGVPIQAYDYTKDPSVLDGDGWVIPGKYRKIYSWNETSDPEAVARFLDRGGSVAMVTNRKKGRPVSYDGIRITTRRSFPMVDGDQSDDRFNTPPGVIVDLYAKGAARNRKSPFVQEVY